MSLSNTLTLTVSDLDPDPAHVRRCETRVQRAAAAGRRVGGDAAGGGIAARHMALRFDMRSRTFDVTVRAGGRRSDPICSLRGITAVTTAAGVPVQPWDVHVGATLIVLGNPVMLRACDVATGAPRPQATHALPHAIHACRDRQIRSCLSSRRRESRRQARVPCGCLFGGTRGSGIACVVSDWHACRREMRQRGLVQCWTSPDSRWNFQHCAPMPAAFMAGAWLRCDDACHGPGQR